MLLSSCVVWRHLEWERFRAECPGGDERLQRLIWERLDDALAWLESLGAEPVWRDTENPLTTGRRYDPRALTELLVEAAGDVELETPLPDDAEPPVLLATGGFRRSARARARSAPARESVERGRRPRLRARARRATTPAMDEFYGRVDARAAGADPGGGLRPARPALRPRGARLHRRLARDHAATRRVARERPRAADRPRALVRASPRRTTGSRPRGPPAAPSIEREERPRRPRRGRGDAHDRRPAGRHAGARDRRRRPLGGGRRRGRRGDAAATRAASPRRSCSASRPPSRSRPASRRGTRRRGGRRAAATAPSFVTRSCSPSTSTWEPMDGGSPSCSTSS